MTHTVDIAVIGAGIAGASVAAELAAQASVVIIEKEALPGYHSTGRSAAMYIPSYGPPMIQALTKASGHFFRNTPADFCQTPLLHPRAEMLIARADQQHLIDTFMQDHGADESIHRLNATEVRQRCPLLRKHYAVAGIIDGSGCDIDVSALHQGYLMRFKHRRGKLLLNSPVTELKRASGGWSITTPAGSISAGIIVNAAGAWADEVGRMAGAEQLGLQPKRRTALTIESPADLDLTTLPLVADIEEAFYLKPDAGRLLLSPANTDPMPPCDAQPEDLDVAVCIDEIERAFALEVTTIVRKWAGLRSFVKDNEPVAGYSKQADHFFWLAGQGGYGIQSAPALSRYAASLIVGEEPANTLRDHGLKANSLGVQRLATQVVG